jgi:hypothetical protein
VDKYGFKRLQSSLFQLKLDFELSIVPKIQPAPSLTVPQVKLVQRMRDEMLRDIASEYEKTIYILEFFQCDEDDIATRIKDNDYGLTQQDLGVLLEDYYHNN